MTTIDATSTIELAPPVLPFRIPSEPFAEEAQWILREHEIVVYDDQVSLDRKAAIGAELVRIQKELTDGTFRGWAARNLPKISERTLRRYKAIFRRQNEPLAQEDPEAFLASIYGNVDADDPSEPGADVNVRSRTGGAKPPSKRPSKKAAKATPKANAAPPSSNSPPPTKTPPPSSGALDKVPFEAARDRVAEALEEAVGDWKLRYGEPLLEHPGVSRRDAGELENILAEFDLAVETVVEKMRSLGS
jgi:hypothetical protein